MFSVAATIAWISHGTPSRAAPSRALSTAAAPPMSIFMSIIASFGFSDRPPESNVTPLPTRHTRPRGAELGVY
jgi:hypothetical protein